MVSNGRHPKKDVEGALAQARAIKCLTVHVIENGHRWGEVRCTCGDSIAVASTPRNQGTHAKQIDRFVAKHDQH